MIIDKGAKNGATPLLFKKQEPIIQGDMADHTLKILSSQTEQVIASFRQMAQDDQYQ
ncbi:MAG: hypothetical protein Fur0044_31550 [Anaerolineae bacterium]